MYDGYYLDGCSGNAIDDNVIRMRDQFARASNSAQAVKIRMVRELRNDAIDIAIQIRSCLWIALRNILKNGTEVGKCLRAPEDRK